MAATAVLKKPTGRVSPGAGKAATQMMALPAIARRSDLPGSDADVDHNTLGGRLAYARLRQRITQDDLAEAIDKVRGTVVAYERNTIMPPIPIVEALAKKLKVSASYLAFGEHGVKTIGTINPADSIVNIDEITYGRDGSSITGIFAIPRSLAESYVEKVQTLKCYVLSHNADAFNLRQGDRVFTDDSVRSLSNDFDTYVIEVPGGVEMIRVAPSFSKAAKVMVEGSRGDKQEVPVKSLKILGAMVSSMRSH